MRRIGYGVLGLTAALVLLTPAAGEAQSADGWWSWALREGSVILDRDGKIGDRRRDRDRTRDRDGGLADIIFGRRGDRDWEEERGRRGKGPPFCRNGQGHPVHGLEWCRRKGFGVYGRSDIRWQDRGWEDIILRRPRDDRRRLGRGGLADVLGDIVLGRVEGERRRLGARSPLEGRWLRLRNGARVLQIRSGSVPVAELTDLDGDGRVDVSLVPRR